MALKDLHAKILRMVEAKEDTVVILAIEVDGHFGEWQEYLTNISRSQIVKHLPQFQVGR